VLSVVALLGVLVLAVINFPVLTGASARLSYGLTVMIPVFAIAGMAAARRLKGRNPRAFEALGNSRL
jgi:hypothetical protein